MVSAATGGEALFADLGHVSTTWDPCLALAA